MNARQIDFEQQADNSPRPFRILRCLIVITAICYFGGWIYAISFDDIMSWSNLSFHFIMLGVTIILLSLCCLYELRKLRSKRRHLQIMIPGHSTSLNAENARDR